MITAIDVSSHQPRDLSALIAEYNPDLVIIRLYQRSERPPQQHTLDQVASTRAHGKAVGGYWWPYHGQDLKAGLEDVLELAARCGGLDCPIPWADVETYIDGTIPAAAEIATLIEAYDQLRPPGGVYTSPEMWRRAGAPDPGKLWNWTANHDGHPNLDIAPYGGWQPWQILGHQWTSKGVDQSVFNPAWEAPQPPPTPTVHDLVNLLGYLQGDVATAIRQPLEAINTTITTGLMTRRRINRIRLLTQQALAAVRTLETEGKS